MAGFTFAETMSGTWTPAEDISIARPFRFTVRVHSGPLADFRKDQVADMEGEVEAEGLAAGAPLVGTMVLRPLFGRMIRYEFEFDGDDGQRYRFAGQKDIRWLDPLRTWTELPGELTDETGHVIGTAHTRFHLRKDGLSFLRSWRPA
ncbi:MAG TPA: hypothetical protein VHE35_09040 [Kofleriaceae bacterium]|nr:hypothetical protein [Kofleriaceae bacterium]